MRVSGPGLTPLDYGGEVASNEVVIVLEPTEQETLGLLLANYVVGEINGGIYEDHLAMDILENGIGWPLYGRDGITNLDAANLIEAILVGVGGFQRARDIMQSAIEQAMERALADEEDEDDDVSLTS